MAKHFSFLIVSIMLTIVLTGCSFGSTYIPKESNNGQTSEEAIKHLETIEGIVKVSYEAVLDRNIPQGIPFPELFTDETMNPTLFVTIESGYAVQDRKAFLQFLSETIWSINDNSPQGYVSIFLTGGVEDGYVWNHEVESIFGAGSFVNSFSYWHNLPDGFDEDYIHRIIVSDESFESRFGSWAGNVPTWNSALLAEGEIIPGLQDPIYDIRFSFSSVTPAYSDTSYICLKIYGERGFIQENFYNGRTTFKIEGPNGFLLEEEILFQEDSPSFSLGLDNYCYPEGSLQPGEYLLTLTTETENGFRPLAPIILKEKFAI